MTVWVTGGYVLLAGSGIALVRAWLLTTLLVLLWHSGRRLRLPLLLSLVMLVVVIGQPMIWTSAGFLYSFVAVYTLLWMLEGRRNGRISPWFAPQFYVLAGLIPVMMIWEQPFGPIHIVANSLLIPLVTFALLPLSLLVTIPGLDVLVPALEVSADLFWAIQETLLAWQWPLWLPAVAWLMPWMVLMYGLRQGMPWSVVLAAAVVMMTVAIGYREPPSALRMFDVGQGQSLMVQDAGKTLLIDTGPAFSPRFSSASSVLLPSLAKSQTEQIDLLIISHSDNDHAGGLRDLQKGIAVAKLLVGQPAKHGMSGESSCHQADEIRLSEELRVRFFSLPADVRGSDNDASCVVQIRWRGRRVLVPGDISAKAERALVSRYGRQLRSDILIASHHGSRSSNDSQWLAAVLPSEVWVSSGFRNRYGHPHPDVEARWREQGIRVEKTSEKGMLVIGGKGHRDCGRCGWQPYWR